MYTQAGRVMDAHTLLLPAVSHQMLFPSKNLMDIWKPAVSPPPPRTHSLPILSVGQQVYWTLMISAADSLWLISGCRFSVVYLIRFSCLHPSIISPSLCSLCKKWGRTSAVCATPLPHPSPAGPPRCRASGFGSGRLRLHFVQPCVPEPSLCFWTKSPNWDPSWIRSAGQGGRLLYS